MIHDEDKRIMASLPFLKGKAIMYVGSGPDPFMEDSHDCLSLRFRSVGYKFIYLPDIIGQLTPEMLAYMFPGLKEVRAEDLYGQIRNRAGLDECSGLLYRLDRRTYFRPFPRLEARSPMDVVEDLLGLFHDAQEKRLIERMSKEAESVESGPLPCSEPFDGPRFSVFGPEEQLESKSVEFDRAIIRKPETEPILDPRAQAIINLWRRIEREFHISFKEFVDLVGNPVRYLSRLNIKTDNRILLCDWEGGPEVKLDNLAKTLYFFYLRHPEGVPFKYLEGYEDEIYHIYLDITGRDDLEGIRRSVKAMVDPFSSNRDTLVSRIKSAFRNIVGDHIAQFYYIDGRSGGLRRIALDRDLVIWDY